jgi:hypothetical protein
MALQIAEQLRTSLEEREELVAALKASGVMLTWMQEDLRKAMLVEVAEVEVAAGDSGVVDGWLTVGACGCLVPQARLDPLEVDIAILMADRGRDLADVPAPPDAEEAGPSKTEKVGMNGLNDLIGMNGLIGFNCMGKTEEVEMGDSACCSLGSERASSG